MPGGAKKIGFLTFGHYRNTVGARVGTAADALHQTVDLAVAAEELGIDGAWLRVHHFGQSLASPIPTLATIGAKTSTIDLGTGVIDMRYENPAHLAEQAGITDLLTGGRLQLGVSRGTPLPAIDALQVFGSNLPADTDHTADARDRVERLRRAIAGEPIARTSASAVAPDVRIEPVSAGLPERIWWGSGSPTSSVWAGEQGMNLLSSMILLADDGRPFHVQQADQFRGYRDARARSGATTPGRIAVLRSVFPITSDDDARYFGRHDERADGSGALDGNVVRTGPTLAGPPEELVRRLGDDDAVQEADYVLFAVPNQLGVRYNSHLLENLVSIANDAGWKRDVETVNT